MGRPRKLHSLLIVSLVMLGSACGDDAVTPVAPDVTPPSPIVDLLAEATDADSALLLSWTAPGDDGTSGRAARYAIWYSLAPPTSPDWADSIAILIGGPTPGSAGTAERWVLGGLLPDSSYYVQVRAEDEASNLSLPSNVATGSVGDAVPPAPISDLRVSGTITTSRAELRWTATGDDGQRGRAHRVELRVSMSPLDAANWEQATIVSGLPEPAEPGTEQSISLPNLAATGTYYFAIRSVDDAGLMSPLTSSLRLETPTIVVRSLNGETSGHPSLRAALSAVRENETIQLGPGIFDGPDNRDLEPPGIRITIRGSGASEAGTILELERAGRAFYFHHPENTGTVLQDLRIRNGYAVDTAPGFGGAIFCFGGASPTLAGCIFENNEAAFQGGAVAARGQSAPLISQCKFRGNRSGFKGGGLSADGESRPSVVGCLFENNEAVENGGAIVLIGGSGGEIRDCEFRDNRAGSFGGAVAATSSSPAISDCLFERNTAGRGGGGLLCLEGSSPTLERCTLRGNIAVDWGGGMYCLVGSSPTIDTCLFEGNSAMEGGGILAFRTSIPSISRSTLVRNLACFGSGIRCIESGSGVRIDRAILALGGIPECSGGVGLAIHLQDGALAELSCTAIFGNAGGDWVRGLEGQENQNGNVAADPRFCDPEIGDFRLREDSPCLNRAGCGLIGALAGCGSAPFTSLR